MRYEIIMLLSWLVQEGYIASFHVTKGKIYVTIFYFYPTWRKNERGEIEEIKGSFRFFERVKDGKAAAARMGRKYDHQKIF